MPVQIIPLVEKKNYRIVAKSLPSVKLIDYISKKTKTDSVMVFHQPFINRLAEKLPRFEMLLGKPMPVAAARNCLNRMKRTPAFNAAKKIQWLIDSRERLTAYRDLAREKKMKLRVNIELDVGLHRGGLKNVKELDEMLAFIRDNDTTECSEWACPTLHATPPGSRSLPASPRE